MLIAGLDKITGADLLALSGSAPAESFGFASVSSVADEHKVTTEWVLEHPRIPRRIVSELSGIDRLDVGNYKAIAFRLSSVTDVGAGMIRVTTEFNLSDANDDNEFHLAIFEAPY